MSIRQNRGYSQIEVNDCSKIKPWIDGDNAPG